MSSSAFFSPRALVTLLLCGAACSIVTGTLPGFVRSRPSGNVCQRTLTFAERVAYQRAIEDIYWRHRIWPRNGGERPDPKPALDAVMSQEQLEKKVTDYLRKSQALEDYWQRPITAQQLQAEMDRIAMHTKQPDVLRELFEALGNDPFVIAECLARPVLAERLLANPAFHRAKRTTNQNIATTTYTLPIILNPTGGCIDDWAATSTVNVPSARSFHTAVWTGSEMIIWGGQANLQDLSTGGRYNPSTDSWTATSTSNTPAARHSHTAVWSGSEMIVWAGVSDNSYVNTGGRYNPATDSWTSINTAGAPSERAGHTAVWTGNEMIVWGGLDFLTYFDTGGRYNPGADSWTATSTNDVPSGRIAHTAVWTGNEMIVWDGYDGTNVLNSGGRYNPGTDSWTDVNTANAPAGRYYHTAVWTGTQMIVWGGTAASAVNTGGRYDPGTDSWTATNLPTHQIRDICIQQSGPTVK